MELRSLMLDVKTAWVEYPGLQGFEVQIANLARKELIALRKRCLITKFDRKSKQPIEELDEDKFVREFTKATVKNWRGLKLKYLEHLLLVKDLDNGETEMEFTEDNAETLVTNSSDFDAWLNEVVFDLENFRGPGEKPSVGSVGKVV